MSNFVIKNIELTNWRKYPLLRAELKEGINVLAGDNEVGKSTLVEGLRFALFVSYKTRMNNTIRNIFPQYDKNAESTVKVDFEIDGKSWTITKTWCEKSSKKTCKLQRKTPLETWEESEAEKQFSKLIGFDEANRDNMEKFGLSAISSQRDPGDFVESGLPSVATVTSNLRVTDDGTVTTGRRLLEIQKHLAREVKKNFKKSAADPKNADLTDLSNLLKKGADGNEEREKLNVIEEDIARQEESLYNVEALLKEVETLTHKIEVKEAEVTSADQDREEFEKRFRKQRSIKTDLLTLKSKFDQAKNTLDQLDNKRDAVKRWQNDRRQAESNIRELNQKLPDLKNRETELIDQKARLSIELEQAKEAYEKQNKLVQALDVMAECKTLKDLINQQQKKLNEREKVEQELQEAKDSVSKLGKIPSDKIIEGLRRKSEEIRALQLEIAQTIEFTLNLKKQSQILLQTDGEDHEPADIQPETPQVFHAVREMKLDLPSIGTMEVRCGAKGLEEIKEEIAKKTKALDKKLAPYGTNTKRVAEDKFSEMERKRIQGNDLKNKIKQIEDSLRDESRFGSADLAENLSNRQQQLTEKTNELKSYDNFRDVSFDYPRDVPSDGPVDVLGDVPGDVLGDVPGDVPLNFSHELEKQLSAVQEEEQKLTTLKENVENLNTQLNQSEKALVNAENQHQNCIKDIQTHKSTLDRIDRELAELKAENWDEEEWKTQRNELHMEMAELNKNIDEKNQLLQQQGDEIEEENLEKLGRTAKERESEKHKLINRLTEANAKLENEAPDISEANLQELKEKRDQYKATIASIETRLAAEFLLHRAVNHLINEEKKAVSNPLRTRLNPKITGIRAIKTEVLFDEEKGKITSIISHEHGHSVEVSYENLSEGTREQLAMAVRMAVAEELAGKILAAKIMVLDDPMTNTDEKRRLRLVTNLQSASSDLQILFVTCHPNTVASLPGHRVEMVYR